MARDARMMSKTGMTKALLVLLACLMLAGCAYAPQPIARPIEGQKTIETARHWQILAAQLAGELDLSVPVFVADNDTSTFGQAFSSMLRTEVLKRNGQLAVSESGAVTLGWKTLVIRYAEPRDTIAIYPGTYTFLAGVGIGTAQILRDTSKYIGEVLAGAAALTLEAGQQVKHAAAPYPIDTEVVFTFTESSAGTLRKEGVAIFYTRRSDAALYANNRSATKRYTLISR